MNARLNPEPLITPEAIAARLPEIAAELRARFDALPVTALVVMKGAFIFGADLVRHLPADTAVEYVHPTSYAGTESSGAVTIRGASPGVLQGRHIVVVEDIIDSGRGYAAVLRWLAQQRPERVTTVALLDKPARRVVPVVVDIVGFTIPDVFVVGYGLDYNERYRGLPAIHALEQS